MKTKIINVVEVIDNSVSSVESFIIPDELQEKEIVARAEKLFTQKAQENGLGDGGVEDAVEDGYYSQGDYYVSLTWSEVN